MSDTLEMAPDFTLPVQGGEESEITLSALRGKPVVLFFYPRDDTPGCTKENEAYAALEGEFAALGVRVFGISKDNMASHKKFMTKKSLTVPLLSDETGTASEDFGVWKEKNMYGKTFMGIERTTVLIDADGYILRRWNKVKVPGHAEEVLEAAKSL